MNDEPFIDPVALALANAPFDDEPVTEEELGRIRRYRREPDSIPATAAAPSAPATPRTSSPPDSPRSPGMYTAPAPACRAAR